MGKIDLVGGYHAGAVKQPWIEGLKLSFNHGQRVQRIAGIIRDIDHMHQQPRSLDVAQEPDSETGACGRPLDQARNVSHHEATKRVDLDGSEMRREGREGILGHLRLGGRDATQEGRFSGVGKADEADVGQQFQGELEQPLLSFLARLGDARCLPSGGREAGIASTAPPSPHDKHPLLIVYQVGQELASVGVHDSRAERNRNDQLGAAPAMHGLAAAVRSVLGPVVLSVFLVAERPVRPAGNDIDVSAVAAVAAVRPASRDMRFSPEAHAAPAAVPCPDPNAGLIDEHGNTALGTQDADEAALSPAVFDRHDAGHLGKEGIV